MAMILTTRLLLAATVTTVLAACATSNRNEGTDSNTPVETGVAQDAVVTGSVSAPPPPVAMPAPMSGNYAAERGRIIPPRYYPPQAPHNAEKYNGETVAAIKSVAAEPVSTFSVDVDTGSYANVRRFLQQGQLPPADAVRTEEMINYFRYDYARPQDRAQPFSVTTDMARTPWNADTRLLRIGIRGYDLAYNARPAANLVFLIDVSGSMADADKLPLVKTSLAMLADRLRPQDRVGIVVYAGATGLVLEPTADKAKVKAALEQLSAGGSTAGGAGIALAYATARANLNREGINRIVIATDGDFNVGVTDQKQLEELITRNREDNITLTTLGFGQGNYNEALMESMADLGNGNYAYIDSASEAKKVLDDELSSTLFTIAKDVKIQIEFNPAYVSEYRLIGYENRILAEEDFVNDKVDAGDIGASHQVTALYELVPAGAKGWLPDRRYDANRAPPTGARNNELAFLKLRYKLPQGTISTEIVRPLSAGLLASAATPRGDMAFATAVAAFGQRLRGDKYLGTFSYPEILALAGKPGDYYRQQFVELVELAKARTPAE